MNVGLWFWADEPLWVQARVAVERAARADRITLKVIQQDPMQVETSPSSLFLEDLRALDLQALICSYLPGQVLRAVLDLPLPVIHLGETELSHPQLWSPGGLYEAALAAGLYLAGRLSSHARVLVVGGGQPHPHSGHDRLAGLHDGLQRLPGVTVEYVPTHWVPELAKPVLEAAMQRSGAPFDAVFGLSDPLAMLARDMTLAADRLGREAEVVGVNGDPLALAAIVRGELNATVDLDPEDLGARAVALAAELSVGRIPKSLRPNPRLITRRNVGEEMARKLIALAELPSRLVGVNRASEDGRTARLEASLDLGRRLLTWQDLPELLTRGPDAIRFTYGYDRVTFYRQREDGVLETDGAMPVAGPSDVLAQAGRGHAFFVADARRSILTPPDPAWPEVRARAVVPVSVGEEVVGILDFHALQPARHTREEMPGLQWLAEQFGVALKYAELLRQASAHHLRPGRHTEAPLTPGVRRRRSSGLTSVLIAEADPHAREAYRQLLERDGLAWRVQTVVDGAEARAVLAREHPQLLILNPELPRGDGWAILHELQARQSPVTLPILWLSRIRLQPDQLALLSRPRCLWFGASALAQRDLIERCAYLIGPDVLAPQASLAVKSAVAYLEDPDLRSFKREHLASMLHLSRNHLSAVFRKDMGVSMITYLNRVRIDRSRLLLQDGLQSINQVAQAAGFEDPAYFARVFRHLTGESPHAYRQRTGREIHSLNDWPPDRQSVSIDR